MVMPMKSRGAEEASRLQRRLRSLHALERINDADFEYLDTRLTEVRARISQMGERMEGGDNGDSTS